MYYRRVKSFDSVGNSSARNNTIAVVDVTNPILAFTGNTPSNGIVVTGISATGQIDITELTFGQFIRSRNGNNYSAYDSGLVAMYNFDKVTALGESSSIVKDASQYTNDATNY